jgi:hypothetical protein
MIAVLKKLKIITPTLIVIHVVVQLIIINFFGNHQVQDAGGYLRLAKQSFNFGYYPNQTNINDTYIFNPGIVNYFMLLLHVSDNTKVLCLFNIIWSRTCPDFCVNSNISFRTEPVHCQK